MHHNVPLFIKNRPKMATFWQKLGFLAKKYQFLAGISVFWVVVVLWCPPHPILRVLDSKKDVLHAIEDITQLFQGHQHQRNIIFCPKMDKKCQFWAPITVFWDRVVSWCSPYPIWRVLDSKKDILNAIQGTEEVFHGQQHKKNPFFAQKWPKNANSGLKSVFPGLGGQLLPCPPFSEDAGLTKISPARP